MPTITPSTTLIRQPPQASGFGDAFAAGKIYIENLMKNVDPQKVMSIAALAATLGLGTAVIYFSHQTGKIILDDDGIPTSTRKPKPKPSPPAPAPAPKESSEIAPDKEKVKPLKRNKKSSRVALQNRAENPEPENLLVVPHKVGDQEMRPVELNTSYVKISAAGDTKPIMELDENNNIVMKSEGDPSGNVLILKQCPRGRKTPCIAPFPLKLETFLRVNNIKYELDFNGYEPRMYGSPWIRFNTEDITDSQKVIEFLIEQYKLKTEKGLTSEQRSMATAYSHLLENHLYWGIALWRWVYDGARSLKEIQLLPEKTQALIPDVCTTVEQAAWFHGIGKMTPDQVKRAVLRDLRSLSEFLGTSDYFLSTEQPTELDCTAFGMLAQFVWNMHGPFHEAVVNKYKNLNDFCWRIRLNFWPDWEDCLNNTQFYTEEPYPSADSVEYPY